MWNLRNGPAQSDPIFTPKIPNSYSGAVLLQILGHEFAAKVVAVGKGVESLRRQQRSLPIRILIRDAPYDPDRSIELHRVALS